VAALSPVTPRLAQPRGAGGPPHCDGPAIRAHERASSDRRQAPEIHSAVGDPRPAAPARARPTAPDEVDSGDTGRRSGTPVRSPAGHPRPMASGQCPTPAREEPQGRDASWRGVEPQGRWASQRSVDPRGRVDAAWLRARRRPGPGRTGPGRRRRCPRVAIRASSRAVRLESEGYPKQRAVSCIQSDSTRSGLPSPQSRAATTQ
jgi:hypothetical protein